MMEGIGIPRGAAAAINDLLDNCSEIKHAIAQKYLDRPGLTPWPRNF